MARPEKCHIMSCGLSPPIEPTAALPSSLVFFAIVLSGFVLAPPASFCCHLAPLCLLLHRDRPPRRCCPDPRRRPRVGRRRRAPEIDRPAHDDIVLILVVVLAYPAGCGGSGADVDPEVGVDARVVVSPPPSSLVTVFLLSSPLPIPHYLFDCCVNLRCCPRVTPVVIVLRSMPTNKDPRNEVGAIIYAVANRALSDHTAKNIFGNVNYAYPITSNPIIEAPSTAIFPYTNAPLCAPTTDHPTSDGNGDVVTATYAKTIATTTMTDDDDATDDNVHVEVTRTRSQPRRRQHGRRRAYRHHSRQLPSHRIAIKCVGCRRCADVPPHTTNRDEDEDASADGEVEGSSSAADVDDGVNYAGVVVGASVGGVALAFLETILVVAYVRQYGTGGDDVHHRDVVDNDDDDDERVSNDDAPTSYTKAQDVAMTASASETSWMGGGGG